MPDDPTVAIPNDAEAVATTPCLPPVLAGIQLGTADPERLRGWYAAAFALPDPGSETFDLGGTTLSIGPAGDLAPTTAEPGRVILNLCVEDCHSVEARLVALESVWIRELECLPCGTYIGTVLDPDGNYVQIFQPG